jgi:hypothetical protein
VARAPDFAHAAGSERFLQVIAPELLRFVKTAPMRCRTRDGTIATNAQATFGQVMTMTTASGGVGAPTRWAMPNASGSISAAASDASSMRRGAVGAIIEYTRITTAIQEMWISPGRGCTEPHTLSAATPAQLSSMNARPAFCLIDRLSPVLWKTNQRTAEMMPPAISVGIVRQFHSPVPFAAGSTATSRNRANVHRLPAMALKTASR